MPTDFNKERAIYFPQEDLMASYYFNQALKILRDSSVEDISNINDAIEIYQCKLIYEHNTSYFSDICSIISSESVKKIFSEACRTATTTLNEQELSRTFNEIEIQYIEQFWDFIFLLKFWEITPEEDMQNFLKNHPNQIPKLIENNQVSTKYNKILSEAIETNFKIAAECIIRAFAIYKNEKIFLPKSLTNDKINQIMLNYLGSKQSEVNANYIEVLSNWPACANSKYNPSPEVRTTAKRISQSLTNEIISDKNGVIRYGSSVYFCKKQKVCKKYKFENNILNYSFSQQWLQKYTDYASILNNFIYVFDFLDKDNLISSSSHSRDIPTLLKIFGPHYHNQYKMTFKARLDIGLKIGEISGYHKILKDQGIRLESAIEWFFNNYVNEEFNIPGFSISLPTDETSLLDKCKAIGPEIERILKAFILYTEHHSIDTNYFPFITIKDFTEIPSLFNRKYLVEDIEFIQPASLLLSDQSLLAYSPTHPEGGRNLFSLINKFDLTVKDFHKTSYPSIDYLVENKFIQFNDNGFLRPTPQSNLLAVIWMQGSANYSDFSSSEIESLVSKKIIKYTDRFFSPDEADYLAYLFNNAKFSNSLALRNKYDHGSGSISDFNNQEMQYDYCMMLAALISILLKINDELSRSTHKGGIDGDYLIDWPLEKE